jgi:hypothetical protein
LRTFVDLVCAATTSSGTGPFALGSAVIGFFGTEMLRDGMTYSYSVQQDSNAEVGTGTWNAASGTLTRAVRTSTNGNAPVAFTAGAPVSFTFTSADIADLLSEAGGVSATARAAFNAYGLQWGIWFVAPPGAGEVLALYSSPISFSYQGNFLGAATAPPITPPAASCVLSVEQQAGGQGAWAQIGTITIGTDGAVSLATASPDGAAIATGDRLRVVAPDPADANVSGFSVTLKGFV